MSPTRRIQNPALFICDLQESFRPAIHQFPTIIKTAQKLLKASEILSIPVYVTTQNASRLGGIVPELPISYAVGNWDKSLFSMAVPQLVSALGGEKRSIAIVGIESHICVTQTALDMLARGHKVYIIADGVSSCNKQEVPIALARLRKEGCVVTTSESWMYEVMGDAGIPEFKQIVGLVKQSKEGTKETLQSLL